MGRRFGHGGWLRVMYGQATVRRNVIPSVHVCRFGSSAGASSASQQHDGARLISLLRCCACRAQQDPCCCACVELREADLEAPLPDHLPEQPRRGSEAGLDDSKAGCWLLARETWRGWLQLTASESHRSVSCAEAGGEASWTASRERKVNTINGVGTWKQTVGQLDEHVWGTPACHFSPGLGQTRRKTALTGELGRVKMG